MKIDKPLEGAKGKGVKRFNAWFEQQQKENGLKWVHISLKLYDDLLFSNKRHYITYFPKFIRSMYYTNYLNKVFNSFVDIQAIIDEGEPLKFNDIPKPNGSPHPKIKDISNEVF